eukprot:TRINITY_DN1406_c0_g3_i2.p1 TRINITY_DN1406_c0_g3~~TRINITY_DN1406_c0_g3_i2.p1  ORF type:complete len:326 (-),score=113.24 TRINITY_DN1406_c0_g3_i2:180-1157(-)
MSILEKIKELLKEEETRISEMNRNEHVNEPLNTSSDDLPLWHIDYNELQQKEVLGKGFFGEVRKAVWKGTDVAVKVIYRESFGSQNDLSIFTKEISILSRLRHPNVILFLAACNQGVNRCIVTEYMANGSLYNLIHHNWDTLEKNPMLKYKMICDIAKGMTYLHDVSILHRDLTPKNILLDSNLNCKVSDFGLSILADAGEQVTTSLGCLPYQSPEVFRGDVYSEVADVYSFGCIVYELVTGSEPQKGTPPLKFANMVAYEDFRPEIPEAVLPKYRQLITDCWTAAPSHRPKFKNILSDLQQLELTKFEALRIVTDDSATDNYAD